MTHRVRAGEPPLVSIVMIFLDAERFIEEAIGSVLAQTYPRWELLLVDDGTTDRSVRIARAYAARWPDRIRYLQHDGGRNRGMSASRNLGLRETRGRYVAFLDADDLYLPGKLERQVAILEANPGAAMVFGPSLMWYSWTDAHPRRYRDVLRPLGVEPDTIVPPPRLLPRFLRRDAYTPGTCSVVVRRDAALAVGGFEEEFRGMYEDQAFFYKLCYVAPVYVDGVCGDLYRQTPDSHSGRMRSIGHFRVFGPSAAHRRFLNWLDVYLRAQGCSDSEVWSALRSELRPYRSRWLYALFLMLQPFEKLRRLWRQRARTPLRAVAPPPPSEPRPPLAR